MLCERCWRNEEAKFQVVTDILDMKVCADCVREALRLNLSVMFLDECMGEKDDSRGRRSQPIRLAS
jgi:hypothetical protein